MRYLSVCSGIEAATVAWHPLGWKAAAYSEIEAFPRAVLKHHYPDTPCHGDFTTIGADEYGAIDLLVGGTPCQSFSVAGLRRGLADERGNLALEYLRLADRTRPRWLVWENVPGVLSSGNGRDFGSFLGGLAELGYGFAYRVLDAQFFGLAQRRRRVFVVGHSGGWRRAGAVLFERHSLSGDTAPRRETGQESAASTGFSVTGSVTHGYGSKLGTDESCQGSVIAFGWQSSPSQGDSVSSHHTPTLDKSKVPAVAFMENQRGELRVSDQTDALSTGGGKPGQGYPAVAFTASEQANSYAWERDVYPTLNAQIPNDSSNIQQGIRLGSAVRRLTPRECERLQGFPATQKTYTIALCRDLSDQQRTNVLAALQCRKLQSDAWTVAGGGWTLSAEAAAHHSSTSLADPAPPVAVDVLIDLERQAVQLHSAGKSRSSALDADGQSAFPLPTGITSFAQLAALLTHAWALAMQAGRAASPASTTSSTIPQNGSSIAIPFGGETAGHAADVASAIETAIRLSTFTTLPSGLDTATLVSTLATLSSCVARAIVGCIPETTSKASSFAVRLTTSQGYTAVPYRGKPAADGPRYKALGNSMAVPVMRWIGERIVQVEAIQAESLTA